MRVLTAKGPHATTHVTVHTDAELKKAWYTPGQGHLEAMVRGPMCVMVECDEEAALVWARVFCEHIFNVPTCVHFDGRTVSMYCGGGSATSAFKAKLERFSVLREIPVT